MITIVVKEPHKMAYSKDVEDDLKEYQKILGGYLEFIGFDERQVLLCNELGKLIGLEDNLLVPGDTIVGNVIIVGTDGEEFRSLTSEEVSKAINRLNNYAIG